MFSLAKDWGLASSNPAKGVPRFDENARKPWLTDAQVNALEVALGEYEDQNIANGLRLILFTGSRHSDPFQRRLQLLCCLHRCSDCYRAERSSSRAGLSSRCGPAPFHGALLRQLVIGGSKKPYNLP
jgi:hypothetical protein